MSFRLTIKIQILIFSAVVIAVFYAGLNARAAFNEQINYQGKLANSAGTAVADGYYCMKFALYDDLTLTEGHLLWSEEWKTDNAHKVNVVSGLFSVLLGSQTSISSVSFDSASRYLEVQLDATCNDSYEETFAPRKQFGTVPAAFEAKKLAGGTWAIPGTIGSTTPNTGAFTTLTAAHTTIDVTMLLQSGSITDSSGAITFDNENLSTTGTLGAGAITSSTLTSGYLPVAGTAGLIQNSAGTGFVKVTSGSLSYDNSTYLTSADLSGYAQYSFGANNFTGTGSFSGGAITSSTLTSGRIPYASTAGLLADSAALLWDNTNSYLGLGALAPSQRLNIAYGHMRFDPVPVPGASTIALAGLGAGNLPNSTGYRYRITFVTSSGETAFGSQSNAVTVVDKTVNGQMALTNIPVCTTAGVTCTARKIYRQSDATYWVYYLATLNDNSTTTYTDNAAAGTGPPYAPSDIGFPDSTAGTIFKGANKVSTLGLNTGWGEGTFTSLTGAYSCSAFGYLALEDLTTARYNSAFGTYALTNATTAESNTGIGYIALQTLTTGDGANTGVGYGALGSLTTSSLNTAMGHYAGFRQSTGSYSVYLGAYAGSGWTTTAQTGVNYNTMVGYGSGYHLITNQSNDVFLGHQAGYYSQSSSTLLIDAIGRVGANNEESKALLWGTFNAATASQQLSINAANTYINGTLNIVNAATLDVEKITNGAFTGSPSAAWTIGTGWAWSPAEPSATAVLKNAAGTGTLTQTSAAMVTPLVVGEYYVLSFTLSAGTWTSSATYNVVPSVAGVTLPAEFVNGTHTSKPFKALSTATLTFTPTTLSRFTLDDVSLKKVTGGNLYMLGSMTSPLKLAAGTAAVGTSPLKFASGTSLTTAEAGAVEFTTDDLYFTITTGAARKGIVLNDGANLTSGKIPEITTNGRLKDSAGTGFVKVTAGAVSYDSSTYLANPMDAIGQIIYGGASGVPTKLAAGSSGQLLRSGGAGAPTWSTSTFADTYGVSTLLYASSANVVAGLATANYGILNTSATGVPSITATPTISTSLTIGLAGTASGQLNLAGTTSGTASISASATAEDIIIDPASTGNSSILADNGVLILGGTTQTNNENLKFDFETTANTVALSSTTGATSINFGSLNLVTSGTLTLGGSTAGTLVTRIKAGAPDESDANGSVVIDSSNARLYFRYGGAWHYTAQTAGFQIPDFETIDPISGDQIVEGDIVLGMIDQTMSDKALHGVWVKWNSIKEELLKEARGELAQSGTWGSGAVEGVSADTLLDKVKNVLVSLGISIKDGIVSIKQLAAQKVSTDVVEIKQIQMVDKATGDIYCTWIENGEWIKVKGECSSVEAAVAAVEQSQQQQGIIEQAAQVAAQSAVGQVVEQAAQQIQQQVQEQVQQQVQEGVAIQIQQQVQEEVTSQIQEQLSLNVKSVASIAALNVDYGTAFDSVGLPLNIDVALDNDSIQNVAITWDSGTPAYDGNTSGTYVFWGSLTLPDNITNTGSFRASANVTVGEQPVTEVQPEQKEEEKAAKEENKKEKKEEKQPSIGDLIKNATAGLLSSMLEFLKWILNSVSQKTISLMPPAVINYSASLSSAVTQNFKSDFLQISSQIQSAQDMLISSIKVLLGIK